MKSALLIAVILPAFALADDPPASVFRQPIVMAQYGRQQAEVMTLMKKKDFDSARKQCEASILLAPQYPGGYYNLACILAHQGKKDEALTTLMKAIEHGWAEPKHIEKDADLESLREDPRFRKAVEAAGKAKPLTSWPEKVEPAAIKNGEVWVTEKNTAWDVRHGVFTPHFDKGMPSKDVPVAKGLGEAGDLLNKWFKDGTAAGHHGDYYDNHDEDHSVMGVGHFPQLTRIKFGKEVTGLKQLQLHRGLQTQLFYNGVVLGNASVAAVSQPYWRSMSRLAYTNPRAVGVIYNQYVNNHLYFYPEHQDHDPGRNGQGGGHGDVFPANTPYLITSQGSSGSDVVFMNAVAATLAAFQPDAKQKLSQNGGLIPAVQMIFRSSNKNVKTPEDYLTGKAHPSVFEGANVDMLRMVKAAHDIRADELPPLVGLKLIDEDQTIQGRDYFDAEPRGERLFDTPCAIARVMRSTAQTRRLVVSAESSRDLNKKPLVYHWVVLRGDPKGVTIKPLNKEGSKAELVVTYQERRPVEPGSKLESNRIDVGVFVHNGKLYSAPAFITFLGLDNQKRTYDDKKRIKSVEYTGDYVDPVVEIRKAWRDEYEYDGKGALVGWTRHRDKKDKQEFTADGALVVEKDTKRRAIKARTVRYVPHAANRNQAPTLEQQLGDEVLHYEYASDEDRAGKVKTRTKPSE